MSLPGMPVFFLSISLSICLRIQALREFASFQQILLEPCPSKKALKVVEPYPCKKKARLRAGRYDHKREEL